ncbi:MAG: putative monooxygenase [Solirubrobacterales bacterium]|nr:putative monooxygenase [Solirubrobacterales bacterium]
MPEVHFRVRWPDGTHQSCTSPSRTIERALCAGASYPVGEFLRRATSALEAGSERVRARYGFACTAAAAEIDGLRVRAAEHPDGHVTVETMYREALREPPPALSGHVPVVIVGGGQAGLSMSWCLSARDVEHVVLERHEIASSWRRQRWDSFCLVTPNWQCRLPGHPYAGNDPDGFMVKDQILQYLDDYVASFAPPVVEGVAVESVTQSPHGTFVVETNVGTLTADQVVLAVGGYHVPTTPRMAERLPSTVTQLHSSRYRSPATLPDGAVLVVGSGQSGAQIAEDLHLEGRTVHLAVGSAPRVARTYRGRDVVAWLQDMGRYDMAIADHPEGLRARKEANHYVTGRDGGRDIDLRRFATEGMHLHGRLTDITAPELSFAGDLPKNLDLADATDDRIKDTIDAWIAAHGVDADEEPRYVPCWDPPAAADRSARLDLAAAGITSVVWATGFRSDWSWVKVPAFDGTGYPTHHRGVTAIRGLSVIGLPWLHTWGSGRFAGIARDADHLASHVAATIGAPARRSAAPVRLAG